MPTTGRFILWDIFEEHLEEAAFLWGQWERAMKAANYCLEEVIEGPEERLRAHLDGLVLGGDDVAERLLLPALYDDDAGKQASAAWALLQSEGSDYVEPVLERFSKADLATTPLKRALELSYRDDLTQHLLPLFARAAPAQRGAILDILSIRAPNTIVEGLRLCIAASQPELLAPALRAARRSRDPAYATYAEYALDCESAEVRYEAIATSFVLGVRAAWSACTSSALHDDATGQLSLALLALRGNPSDKALLRSALGGAGRVSRHVVWALGFSGDAESTDTLVSILGDDDVASLAGESFSAVTGIAIQGHLACPGVHQGPDAEEPPLDDALPEFRAEDHLAKPNASAVQRCWQGLRTRLAPDARWLHGQQRGLAASIAALGKASMWRRPVLSLELVAQSGHSVYLNLGGWARHQRAF